MEEESLDFKGVIFRNEEEADPALLDRLPDYLQEFYSIMNGIVAYNGGLTIRSCSNEASWHALGHYWTGEEGLHKTYPNLLPSDIPFAQDCLGDQYFLRDDEVWILSAETGEVMEMEVDFQEFLRTAIEDPVEFLAMEPLAYYLQTEGDLEAGQLLHIVPALSEEEEGDDIAYHIEALSVEERLKWLNQYFTQNHLSKS